MTQEEAIEFDRLKTARDSLLLTVANLRGQLETIKEAFTQQEQKPVLLLQPHREGFWCADLTCSKCYTADFRFKHASFLKPAWVGLTDEDCKGMSAGDKVIAMWANRILKEKNNG